MKKFERCRTKFGMAGKLAALALGAVLCLSLFASCALSENSRSGNILFVVDGPFVSAVEGKLASRAVNVPDKKMLSAEFTLSGEYEESMTVPLAEGEEVCFEGIPVGLSIVCGCTVYAQESEGGRRTVYYAGKSETIKINPGMNYVNIKLGGTGSLGVTVTIPAQNDLNLTCTTEEDSFIFSAVLQESSSSEKEYLWFVDGVAQDEKSGAFTLNTEGMNVGTYQISVVCEEKSGAATVKIE